MSRRGERGFKGAVVGSLLTRPDARGHAGAAQVLDPLDEALSGELGVSSGS